MKFQINSCESLAIISDESTDEQDNYVLHVLCDFISDKAKDVQTGKLTELADCVYWMLLTTLVSQAIIKTISKDSENSDKVSVFISDKCNLHDKIFWICSSRSNTKCCPYFM